MCELLGRSWGEVHFFRTYLQVDEQMLNVQNKNSSYFVEPWLDQTSCQEAIQEAGYPQRVCLQRNSSIRLLDFRA